MHKYDEQKRGKLVKGDKNIEKPRLQRCMWMPMLSLKENKMAKNITPGKKLRCRSK